MPNFFTIVKNFVNHKTNTFKKKRQKEIFIFYYWVLLK